MKRSALATKKLHNRESDGIGTAWRSSSKDAMRAIVDRRRAHQVESIGTIKDPEHKQVGETLDVGQAGFELRQDFEDALRLVLDAKTFRNLLSVCVRTANVSNGLRGKHIEIVSPARDHAL